MDGTRKRNRFLELWRRLRKNRLAVVGMAIFLALVFMAVFAGQIAPYGYSEQDLVHSLEMPSAAHLLGTDDFGRDIFSRIVYGGRVSLLIALLGIAISLVAGGLIGVVSGYYSGRIDGVLMRVMDVIMAIPGFLLAVCVSAALGTGVINTAIAIAIAGIPGYARLMRALVLAIRGREYVEAARACGEGNFGIMIKEIVPNTLSPIIVDTTLRIGAYILMISSLSFIGLGVQPPDAEWGSMLSAGRQYIRSFWPIVTFPGLAIMATLFGLNLFGDGIRDALDPRLKR
jgi:peptide/nickel transport system permease protein